jgi:hypothetical protein
MEHEKKRQVERFRPVNLASAVDCFCYDPSAADGFRWTIFATSPIQRLYHSSSVLLPDGTTIIVELIRRL